MPALATPHIAWSLYIDIPRAYPKLEPEGHDALIQRSVLSGLIERLSHPVFGQGRSF